MYKRFFLGILSIVCIISVFFILISYLLSNILSDPTKIILDEHRKIAENIKTSKVLVISGSNTFFSIDTKLMSEKLDYPVINLGVNAGLGLDYIFYDAKKSIKDNDIVILPLEYDIYYEDDFSRVRILQIWQDREYFNKMSFIDEIKLLYSIPLELNNKAIKVAINNLLGLEYQDNHKIIDKDGNIVIYNQDIINRNGDRVNNVGTKKIILKEPFLKDRVYLDKNIKANIIDFLNYCKEKNVKVFVTYPSFYYKQKYFEGYNLKQVEKINDFWQRQNVIILGQYTDFIYTDKNDFYDTRYHLNIKGREKRTEQLIELLKPYINNN